MPIGVKQFKKIVKRLENQARTNLRYGLSELLKFEEVLFECEKLEQRIALLVDER